MEELDPEDRGEERSASTEAEDAGWRRVSAQLEAVIDQLDGLRGEVSTLRRRLDVLEEQREAQGAADSALEGVAAQGSATVVSTGEPSADGDSLATVTNEAASLETVGIDTASAERTSADLTGADLASLGAADAETVNGETSSPDGAVEDGQQEGKPSKGRMAEAVAAARKRVVAAAPSPPPERAQALETTIGAVWFSRVGLALLMVFFALFARWVVPALSPALRVTASYLAAVLLGFVGLRLSQRLPTFGRSVVAGGLAVAFFTSFAAHFVPPMACLPLVASLLLMAAFVVALLICAEQWDAPGIAGLALTLGYVAAFVASYDAEIFSMAAIVFLAAAAVGLVVRHDWLPLGFYSVLATFSFNLLTWLANPALAANEDRFALNLAALTAYYLLYVSVDLVFHHRLARRGIAAFPQRDRVAGRCIGATAVAAFGVQGVLLFHSIPSHWQQVHLFLAAAALFQLVLTVVHRIFDGGERMLHLTSAVTFVTLALFASVGGLALNMALAAEALLLLVLGRTTGNWFLRPLSQSVLVVNFFHFWFSEAREVNSWPLFLGAVVMASVYFVKSHHNDTWAPVPDEARFSPVGGFSRWWRKAYGRASTPIAYWQTLSGAALISYQCDLFLAAPYNALMLVGLAAITFAAGIAFHSAPILQGVALMQISAAILLLRQLIEAPARWPSWTREVNQGVVLALALLALAAVWVARHRHRRTYMRFASAALLATGLGALGAGLTPAVASHRLLALGLPAVVAVVMWISIEIWPSAPRPVAELSRRLARFYRGTRRRRAVFAAFAATAPFASAGAVLEPFSALAWLSLWGLALAAAALVRGSAYLLLGVLIHQLVSGALVIFHLSTGSAAHNLLKWWVVTAMVVVAAALFHRAGAVRRASFGVVGFVVFFESLLILAITAVAPEQRFDPVWIWALPLAGLWWVIEALRACPVRCPVTTSSWQDRWGSRWLPRWCHPGAGVGSILTAAVLGCILGRALPTAAEALGAMALAALLLLAATVLRSSPYLMAGLLTLLGLMLGHRTLYLGDLSGGTLLEWTTVSTPVLAAAALLWAAPRWRRGSFFWGGLVALTLGLVALAQLIFEAPTGGAPRWLWGLSFAACWLALEQLQRGVVAASEGATADWRDELDLRRLLQCGRGLAVALSAVTALLLVAMTWRQVPDPIVMVSVVLAYAIFFVALTAWWKSPPLAAAFAVCLLVVHPLIYWRVGARDAAGESPLLAAAVLVVTLVAGAAVEAIFRAQEVAGQRRPAWWGAWYPYASGFALSALVLAAMGEEFFGAPAYATPLQLVPAVLALAAALRFELRWLARASLLYAALMVLAQAVLAAWLPAWRAELAHATLFTLALLVLMERLVAWVPAERLSEGQRALALTYRWGLVAGGGVLAAWCFSWAEEVGGLWATASWSLLALLWMGLGFAWRSVEYRRVALVLFFAAILRLFFLDVPRLDLIYSMMAFLCLGVTMVLASYLYNRYREEIGRWL